MDNIPLAIIVTVTFLFGGLMFGPDLDTHSSQYTRWGIMKNLWYPYQKFFKHRSRWSHGLIFGTFLRIIYFIGVLTLFSFLITFLYSTYIGGDIPQLFEFTKNWQQNWRLCSDEFWRICFLCNFCRTLARCCKPHARRYNRNFFKDRKDWRVFVRTL